MQLQDLTIGRFVRARAAELGDRQALHFLEDGRTFTYAALHQRSDRVAAALQSAGIGKGTHVALMLDNTPEFLLLLIALGKVGAVAVPLPLSLRGALLADFLRRADTTVLILGADSPVLDEAHALDGAGVRQVLTLGAATTGGRDAPARQLEELVASAGDLQACEVAYSDLAMLMYTSGTTGPSKANMFSHAHVLQYAMEQARAYGYRQDDVVYTCLPISHANGLLSSAYAAVVAGAQVALTRKFSVSRFWDEVRRANATVVGLLGSTIDFLWKAPALPNDADNPLRTAIMIPVPHYARAFAERFGVAIVSSYGLTDYGLAAIYTPEDPPAKLGSAGRPRPGVSIRVVDEHDLDLPAGRTGEIILRSDNMWATSSGYYKMPAETLGCLRNLWFHTGDMGYLDDDGYLYFTDRKKDAIRRRGENVSAFEVEKALLDHELVKEAAVFAVHADQSEDEIAAWVVLHDGARLSAEDLASHCSANLAAFMTPRYIRFVCELPKTQTGKIEKHKLRTDAADNLAQYWDRGGASPRTSVARNAAQAAAPELNTN